MSSVTNSIKKLKKKKEEFSLKINELMKLDANNVTVSQDTEGSVLDCSFDSESNLTINQTVPKQVYNSSQDILFKAFHSEVLLKPDSPTINASPHPNVNANSHTQEDGYINPMYLNPTYDEEASNFNEEMFLNLGRKEILALIASVPILNERCCNLESRCSSLESNYSNLQNSYSALKKQIDDVQAENTGLKNQIVSQYSASCKEINLINRYSRRNSLLGHRLRNVPTNLHGTSFSKFVAAELRRIMPGLSISYEDIDTSHILYYELDGESSYPVVVIKFVNRDLRNNIWHWENFSDSDVFFTEHLTAPNRKLFKKAEEIFSNAWTEQCRIFVMDSYGRKKEIVQEADLVTQSLIAKSSSNPPENANVETCSNEVLPQSLHFSKNHFHQQHFRKKKQSRNSHQPRKVRSRRFNRISNNQYRPPINSQVYHSTKNNHPPYRNTSFNPRPIMNSIHQNRQFIHSVPNLGNVVSWNGHGSMQNTNVAVQQDTNSNPNLLNAPSVSNSHHMSNKLNSQPSTLPPANNHMPMNNQHQFTNQQTFYSIDNPNFRPRGMLSNNTSRLPTFNNMVPPPGYR